MKIEVKITDESGNIRQYVLSGSLPSDDVPLMIWGRNRQKINKEIYLKLLFLTIYIKKGGVC